MDDPAQPLAVLAERDMVAAHALVGLSALCLVVAAGVWFEWRDRIQVVSPAPRRLLARLAVLSAVAGLVHLWVTPEHLREHRAAGVFMLVVALCQGGWAIAVLVRPGLGLLWLAAGGNAAITVVWLLSRTVGLPGEGHGARAREPVGALDTICTVLELAVLTAVVIWTRRSVGSRAPAPAAFEAAREVIPWRS